MLHLIIPEQHILKCKHNLQDNISESDSVSWQILSTWSKWSESDLKASNFTDLYLA